MKQRIIIFSILFTSLFAQAALPDFAAIKDTRQKKQSFFNYIRPQINAINQGILKERTILDTLLQKFRKQKRLSSSEQRLLTRIATHYEQSVPKTLAAWQTLLARVDVVPASMVMAQAANESAWGTSRFAQKGANFFGQWCYQKGCGLVPSRRSTGMHHEVRVFKSARESIASYMNNLNTNRSYQLFRKLRADLRAKHQPLAGTVLAQGLEKYSERGLDYVKEIKAMIRVNRLEKFDE